MKQIIQISVNIVAIRASSICTHPQLSPAQNNPGNKSPLNKPKKFANPDSKNESSHESKAETNQEAEKKSIGKNENKPEPKVSIAESLIKKASQMPKIETFTSTQK